MTSEQKSSPGSPSLPRFLAAVTELVSQRPGVTLAIVALLTFLSAVTTIRFLTFKTDRSDLIDSSAEFHQRWERYTEKFGQESDVVIVVEGDERQKIIAAIDQIGAELDAEPDLFRRVLYRIDSEHVKKKSLQYLKPVDLEAIEAQLEAFAPVLEGHWDQAGLEAQTMRLTQILKASGEFSEITPAQAITQTDQFVQSLSRFIDEPGDFQNPWPKIVSEDDGTQDSFQPRYQLIPDGTMGFVIATPRSTSADFAGSSASLARMREICQQVNADFDALTIGMTGIPVLEADEMQRSQQDMFNASGISFLGVGLILLIGFRGFRHPFLSLVMLAVALVWSLGYTTLAVGHLNILSVSFAAILIGLGIDFAIHFLARYLELRHHNEEFHRSLALTSYSVGTGIVTASVTTAMAFLCATFTDFLGVAELGIIAGGGILICAAATFVVLPALITLADKDIEPQRLPTPFQGTFLRWIARNHPAAVTIVTLLAILAIGAQAFEWKNGQITSRIRYDANLLNLQAKGVASVELQKKLFDKAEGSLLYAVSLADSIDEVRIRKERFLALPTVGRVDEMASYLPRFPASETNLLVQVIHARLGRLADLPQEFPQINPKSIGQALDGLYETLRSKPEPAAQTAAETLDHVLERLTALDLPQQMELLSRYQGATLTALHRQFSELRAIASTEPVVPQDFTAGIHERFLSESGDWLLRIYPNKQIWEEAPLEDFVKDVRSVDPDATGTPLQNHEAARQIRESYFDAAIYALVAVTLILLIDALNTRVIIVTLVAPLAVAGFAFALSQRTGQPIDMKQFLAMYTGVAILVAAVCDFQSTRDVMFMLLPPIAGSFLMLGLFGILGVDLNPANLIVLPLILGIGVDDGVHVTHDFRHCPSPYETSPSTINAITLTSLTSMVGFGSMLVASHQGLVSLGIVLVVGVGSCLFVSLVTLPAILTLVDRWQNRGRDKTQVNGGQSGEGEVISISIRQPENGVA